MPLDRFPRLIGARGTALKARAIAQGRMRRVTARSEHFVWPQAVINRTACREAPCPRSASPLRIAAAPEAAFVTYDSFLCRANQAGRASRNGRDNREMPQQD